MQCNNSVAVGVINPASALPKGSQNTSEPHGWSIAGSEAEVEKSTSILDGNLEHLGVVHPVQ